MGSGMSVEEWRGNFLKKCSKGGDIRVNKNIEMFSSPSSSEDLRQHYEKRKAEAGDRAADMVKSLLDRLGSLTPAPELAGLGSLFMALIIDIEFGSPPESIKEALRCVFAEEKASEVRDQIDECLKKSMMYINNKQKLKTDIKWIERGLSLALTKLKNSMLKDGHMSSEALKAWVNGAAFHIQMLIHLVRLEGTQTCDHVDRLLAAYLRELDQLLDEHHQVVKGKCKEQIRFIHPQADYARYMEDEDSKWVELTDHSRYEVMFKAYYEDRYGGQKRQVQQYFNGVRQNLQGLVRQRGFFRVD